MANHPSALKRIRQTEKRQLRNAAYRSKVKTTLKKYLSAAEQNLPESNELLKKTMLLLHKGVSKGIFHKNTAARKISRLSMKAPTS